MAACANWRVKRYVGDTLRYTITWETGDPPVPVDLTGFFCEWIAYNADGTVLFLINSATIGGITLGGATGVITLYKELGTIPAGDYETRLILTEPSGDIRTRLIGELLVQ